MSIVTRGFIFSFWQNFQAIWKVVQSYLNLAFRKTASSFTCSRSVIGNFERSVKCPRPPSPRVRTHLPFIPDDSSLLVEIDAMLLCCVLACGGWVLSTTLPCGCGHQTQLPLFARVYMIPRQLANVTPPTQLVLTTFCTQLSSCISVMKT